MATLLRTNGDNTMEAARWKASQASREQPALDPRSVLLVAQRLMDENDEAGARSVVAAYRASLKGAE